MAKVFFLSVVAFIGIVTFIRLRKASKIHKKILDDFNKKFK